MLNPSNEVLGDVELGKVRVYEHWFVFSSLYSGCLELTHDPLSLLCRRLAIMTWTGVRDHF